MRPAGTHPHAPEPQTQNDNIFEPREEHPGRDLVAETTEPLAPTGGSVEVEVMAPRESLAILTVR